jgi:hypothetical protein
VPCPECGELTQFGFLRDVLTSAQSRDKPTGFFAPSNGRYLRTAAEAGNRTKADGHHRTVAIGPSLPIGCDEQHQLSGVSADAANGFWPRQARERTFLVTGAAGITQVFAAECALIR